MNIYTIYKITNNINNNVYIGYTSKKISYRLTEHKTKSKKLTASSKLYKAMREIGQNNFSIESIFESKDQTYALCMEEYFITVYDSAVNGYNTNRGRGGSKKTCKDKKANIIKEEITQKPVIDSRPLCKVCSEKPAAVNYHRKGKTHYRSKCEDCLYHNKKSVPRWKKAGYAKKKVCDKCGFKSTLDNQITVFFVDGNMNNVSISNLKSVCANCRIEIHHRGWRQGDLLVDQ